MINKPLKSLGQAGVCLFLFIFLLNGCGGSLSKSGGGTAPGEQPGQTPQGGETPIVNYTYGFTSNAGGASMGSPNFRAYSTVDMGGSLAAQGNIFRYESADVNFGKAK